MLCPKPHKHCRHPKQQQQQHMACCAATTCSPAAALPLPLRRRMCQIPRPDADPVAYQRALARTRQAQDVARAVSYMAAGETARCVQACAPVVHACACMLGSAQRGLAPQCALACPHALQRVCCAWPVAGPWLSCTRRWRKTTSAAHRCWTGIRRKMRCARGTQQTPTAGHAAAASVIAACVTPSALLLLLLLASPAAAAGPGGPGGAPAAGEGVCGGTTPIIADSLCTTSSAPAERAAAMASCQLRSMLPSLCCSIISQLRREAAGGSVVRTHSSRRAGRCTRISMTATCLLLHGHHRMRAPSRCMQRRDTRHRSSLAVSL